MWKEFADIWQQFGLSGVVIGALFGLILFILKGVQKTIEKIGSDHREERKEWLQSIENLQSRIERLVDRLNDELRELSKTERRR